MITLNKKKMIHTCDNGCDNVSDSF